MVEFSRIVKEAKIRYAEIEELSFAKQLYSKDFIKVDTIPIAMVKWNEKLLDTLKIKKEKELRTWLQREFELDTLFIKRSQ